MKIDKEKYMPWIMASPALAIVFSLTLYPLFYSLYVSTRSFELTALWKDAFIGIENYRRALNSDLFFWSSLLKTILYALGCLSLEMPLGLGVAFLLNRAIKGRRVVRTILALPMVAAPVAVGLTWRYMYHHEFGVFNYFVRLLGITPPGWLTNLNFAMISVIIFDVWQWTPFVALVLLAGLQSLSPEPYESATIYGASMWQKFRYITLPSIRSLMTIVALLRLIDLLKLYDAVYALTRGGPGIATEVLTWYLYKIGFKFWWLGYASAIALMFQYLVIILSVITIEKMAKL